MLWPDDRSGQNKDALYSEQAVGGLLTSFGLTEQGPDAADRTERGPGAAGPTEPGPGAVGPTERGPGAVDRTGPDPGAVGPTGPGPGAVLMPRQPRAASWQRPQ